LQLLGRDELVAIVDRFELSPPDRRAKDGLIESVAASKKATLSEILTELSRDRLKEICRALEVDDSGREKAALIERLLAGKAAESAKKSAAPTNGAASNGAPTTGAGKRGSAPPRTPEPVEVQPGEALG